MTIEHVRQTHRYSKWAFERVWKCVETLSEDQFAAPLDYSLGSIRSQFLHVIGVEERWFARLSGASLPAFPTEDEFGTIASVHGEWLRVTEADLVLLDHWTDDDLSVMIDYDMPHRGGMKHNTRSEILAHVLNHATDHRAQILAGLHRLGAPTVEQDMMFFFWEQTGQM